MKYLYFFVGLFIINSTVLGIVPKPGISIVEYEKPAKSMNNIGHLFIQGKKSSSCSATLIGQDGDIGIVLTAGHCVSLSEDEIPTKCRNQTISFSSEKTNEDLQRFPVIGRYALNDYIEQSADYENDMGLVFIDMSDIVVGITPRQILLDRNVTQDTSLVHVAGYGKTSFLDDLKQPKRRIMATQAIRTKKNNHEMWLLDETEIEGQPTLIPIGDHPDEGDSGGPILDTTNGAVMGVVSHKEGTLFYSEPLYEHAEWLLEQIKYASRYFIFTTRQSGKLSESTTWRGGRKPVKFKNAYGEINPIVVLTGHALSLDTDISPYAIDIVNEGGTLDIESGIKHVEVLRAKAPSTIQSTGGGTLIADEVKVENSNVSIRTNLQVLYHLHIQQGVVLDIQKDNPERGITLVENGALRIDGTLKTHHVRFAPSSPTSQEGTLYLSGLLTVDTPLNHSAHIMEIATSRPGKIDGNYNLNHGGTLSFNFDSASSSSAPVLIVEGVVNFNGGKLKVNGLEILPIGFEQTLLSAEELNISHTWQGTYSTNLVEDDSEIVFIHDEASLKMKVIPRTNGSISTPSDPLDEHL
jgi:hypothetical protein